MAFKKSSKINIKNPNAGHRERLRQRFVECREALPDYEILEMLLFMAFNRKDTKGLSKLLLDKFRCFNNIINADENQLRSVEGVGDSVISVIKLVQEIYLRILKDDIKPEQIKIKSLSSVIKYVKSKMGNMVTESAMVLFLNNGNVIVSEKIVGLGDVEGVNIYKNMIITQATQNGAKALILVHNHPSGDPRPSPSDIALTRDLAFVLNKVNMKLLDHIIVSSKDYYSFVQEGTLK